ncbi:HD domain-domain-containing protein [Naematelia encephala]|uniref:5'-deoxynucleotidase n=1 Tax=Naematelia encephala TaxID=71784 RepID=A0A1Y2AFT9_9TREE|nr:HD domain-domain-containing protein [Naematelia encephala]
MPTAVPVAHSTPAHSVVKMSLNPVQVLGAGGKPLPAPYRSTGNEALDTLAFLHILEQLKVQKRSGWIREGVREPESISDHMCRMALMAMMLPSDPSRPLDIPRCVMMALVHDLAEAHVGDITPVEGVPPHVKHQLEEQAMESFLDEMLGGEGMRDAQERFRSLWNEYEARETPESKLVKDLDRLELALQGVEYERSQDIQTLNPFFAGSIPHLEHPVIRKWAETLMEERKQLWESKGKGEQERAGLEGISVGSAVTSNGI